MSNKKVRISSKDNLIYKISNEEFEDAYKDISMYLQEMYDYPINANENMERNM